MNQFISDLQKWYSAPFNSQGSALNWAIFTAFIITVAFMWSRVLREID
jgi:hypothetical protein